MSMLVLPENKKPLRFADRRDAGMRLAKALAAYDSDDAVVYALPRGGVVVGDEVAKQLELPLALIIPRKIGHPENDEYAVCAVTEDGELVCNEEEKSKLNPAWLAVAIRNARTEAIRRRGMYGARIPATGKVAILVDDGVATGLTMRAAIRSLRRELPLEIIVATPVAPHEVAEYLEREADDVIVLDDSESFLGAIETHYATFPQVSDQEVMDLLERRTEAGLLW